MAQILKDNIETAPADDNSGEMEKLNVILKEKQKELTEYDESMVRKYIEEITVYEDKLTVCFKAKVEIDIER